MTLKKLRLLTDENIHPVVVDYLRDNLFDVKDRLPT